MEYSGRRSAHYLKFLISTFIVKAGEISVSRKSPIARDAVCKPKAHGEISVFNIEFWNLAATAKLLWAWRFNKEKLQVKRIYT